MKRLHIFTITAILLSAISCSKERPGNNENNYFGQIRIFLKQNDSIVEAAVKSGAVQDNLPAVDDFNIEIFNSKAQRIYKKKYIDAKAETIKLNSGDFKLKAFCGDSLAYGFDKPFFMANQPFTVHGYIDNNKTPDQVNAIAKLSNVKLAVKYGSKISEYYSDYYAVVRHSRLKTASVKFSKSETRNGYIPSGDLYIEVYAQLGGNGQKDSLVYFKSEPVKYLPNDFVTFNIEAPGRTGDLNVNITVDNSVEKIEESVTIPATSMPAEAPKFSSNGISSNTFDYRFATGTGANVEDASLSFLAAKGIASALMSIESDYLQSTLGLPAEINLFAADASLLTALKRAGIYFIAKPDTKLGFIDFSGTVDKMSLNAPFKPENPICAKFTVKITDKAGKTGTALFNLVQTPLNASIEAIDYNIWGWKITGPAATIKNVSSIASNANIKLQYSPDGTTWNSVAARQIDGNKVYFNDITGLTAGTEYRLRTIFNDDNNNVSDIKLINTEKPEQIGNNGFEEYTENKFTTSVTFGSSFEATWWQIYKSTGKWWGVNSPVTINSQCTWGSYQDYKSFPTVSIISDGAYSGNSLMIAAVAIDDLASDIKSGSTREGELFIGEANDKNEGDWAKASEGHSFGSRPSALSFMHKFDPYKETPYSVSVEILAADGSKIAEGLLSDKKDIVTEWSECRIPIVYNVSDKKAAEIRLSIKAIDTPNKDSRKITVNTISGAHTIHAGSILYIDNVELKYE